MFEGFAGVYTFFLGGFPGIPPDKPTSFASSSARWVRRRHIDTLARQRPSGRSLRALDEMLESLEEDART